MCISVFAQGVGAQNCQNLYKKVHINAYAWIISVEKLDVMYIDSSMDSSCTISFNIYMVLCQPQHHPLSSMVLFSLYTVHLQLIYTPRYPNSVIEKDLSK